MSRLLKTLSEQAVERMRRDPVDAETLAKASAIVDDVRARGEAALRHYAESFGDVASGHKLVHLQIELKAAFIALPEAQRALLMRTAERIRAFALAQRKCLSELSVPIEGGRAGHVIAPVERAGCYAPGGRHPLPSSVLMTAVTARAAGVQTVWVASPRPSVHTLAAAYIAGADALLAVGGAQAIAALAFGAGVVPACDVIVGPGNRFVTAAKQRIAGQVAIDMLAGPSELLVLADTRADVEVIAADLLAQAEHDTDAFPALVLCNEEGNEHTAKFFLDELDQALRTQLETLPTANTARAALANGFAVVCDNFESAARLCDRLAPEHLEVMMTDIERAKARLKHYGAIFLGAGAAEVFGDYGAGPNHVLPTGESARFTGGLSVFNFLRIRTWLQCDEGEAAALVQDAADLARQEGLEAHARAAEWRRKQLHSP
jgi:histidinol dehydrogenase